MGSIVGYVGQKYSWEVIREALVRLECRGYDAAGFACIDERTNQLACLRALGPIGNIVQQISRHAVDGLTGIGQTRWMTKEPCTIANANPQCDAAQQCAVVCSGALRNYHQLRAQLETQGAVFSSSSDAELIANIIATELATTHDIIATLSNTCSQLRGAYAAIIICQQFPDSLLLIRNQFPLCIGVGRHEHLVASEPLAFSEKTHHVVFMPPESYAHVNARDITVYAFNGKALTCMPERCESIHNSKDGFESFMLKEIYEQRQALHSVISLYKTLHAHNNLWPSMGVTPQYIQQLKTFALFGCGTSCHAARIGQFFFGDIAKIPTSAWLASELRYMPFFAQEHSLYIAISQSGETADVLETTRMVNALDLPTVALCNVASSSLVREAGGFLLMRAGPELSVAATKSFACQLAILYLLAHYCALERGVIAPHQLSQAYDDLHQVSHVLHEVVEQYERDIMHIFAPHYARYDRFVFVGRHVWYPFALEMALKLKEVAYLFAHAYPGGELKHGPLALIDETIPVVLFSHTNPVMYQKLIVHAQEIKARGGHLIIFGFNGQIELEQLADTFFAIPPVPDLLAPLAMTGLMQIIVYYIAKELGRSIDRPRNLGKSVTVE